MTISRCAETAVGSRISRRVRAVVLTTALLPAVARAQAVASDARAAQGGVGCSALLCNSSDPAGERESDRIDPDRPHFPEASTAVGLGRAVLESGFTMTSNGTSRTYSYPEAFLRLGVFADWFEVRVGQNVMNERRMDSGVAGWTGGLQDTYFGVKVALAAQNGLLPAIALIPQMTAPTGVRGESADRVLPGVNVDFGWNVVKNAFDVELLVANNEVRDELGGIQHQLATGLTGVFDLTKSLEAFAEWDAYYPRGGLASTSPQHYAVGGLVYFIGADMEVDARAGAGLNDKSSRWLVGFGLAVRR